VWRQLKACAILDCGGAARGDFRWTTLIFRWIASVKSNGAGRVLLCPPSAGKRLKLFALEFEPESELDPAAAVGKRAVPAGRH